MTATLNYPRPDSEYPQAILRGLVASPQSAGDHEGQLESKREWDMITHAAKWDLITRAAKFDAAVREAATIAEEVPPTRTVLEPDEVSLESISMALAKGPVVIKATDAQARRIMERHRRDAFPPE